MSLLIGFSGQGRQYAGMFNILKTDDFGQSWLNDASRLLNLNLSDENVVGQYCHETLYSQLFIVLLAVGAFRSLQQHSTFNPVLCGYSLGEVSAFCASTNLPLEAICQLIEMRVKSMQAATNKATHNQPAGLVVLRGNLNLAIAEELSERFQCYIAIMINDDHYVIGGLNEKTDLLITAAKTMGIAKSEKISINLPAHTPLLTAGTRQFLPYLHKQFNDYSMQFPILNTLTVEMISSTPAMLTILANELSQTLHWDKLMRIAAEYGVSRFFELGPKDELKNMFSIVHPGIKAYALNGFLTIAGITRCLEQLTC